MTNSFDLTTAIQRCVENFKKNYKCHMDKHAGTSTTDATDLKPDCCSARVWCFKRPEGEVRQCSHSRASGSDFCTKHHKRANHNVPGFNNCIFWFDEDTGRRGGIYQGDIREEWKPIVKDPKTGHWLLLWNTPTPLFYEAVEKWVEEQYSGEPISLHTPFTGRNGRFETGVKRFLQEHPKIKLEKPTKRKH